MKGRTFIIYTRDKAPHTLKAPSLRTALRNFGGDPAMVVAAVDATCLPAPRDEERPFLAVFLKNRNFKAPVE